VKLARIKGLSETVVIWKHCLRNALIPVLTLWGVFVGNLITGAIVTETVFAWPGIGRLTYEAVIYRDFPLLQATIILKSIPDPDHQPRRRHPLCLCRSAHPAGLTMAHHERSPSDGTAVPPPRPRCGARSVATPRCRPAAHVPRALGPDRHHLGDRRHGVFAPLLAPYSPIDQTLRDKLLPPIWVDGRQRQVPPGPDAFGRDILSRLIYGARISLLVALLALTAAAASASPSASSRVTSAARSTAC